MAENFIIIVARNNLHLTKQAVASALAQDIDCDVFVFNNASTDGSVWWLKTKPIAVVSSDKQLSLAECWNRSLRVAWQTNHKHALVLNNDVVIRPDTYRMLLAHGGPFVTCVSVDSEDRLGAPGDRTIEELKARQRLHPDFSCFLIHKEVTETIGKFDEECYPAYLEDCFAHVAMWRRGIHAVCIDLPFLHYGASTVKNCDLGERARIERGAAKNKMRFKLAYGCVPGTPEYEALFDEEYFGVDSLTPQASLIGD